MNYLRYWQASGKSIKTSIRTKTRLGQIVQEGRFRGGIAPYGYELVKRGRMGKKNRELYDIEINPEEAAVVRKMYDLADRYGYGGRRISSELAKMGIINERTKEPFHYSSIQSILRNIMYIGILRSVETKSDIFPELQIVEPEQYERITKIREQRSASFGQSELSNEMTDTDGQPTHTFPKKFPEKHSYQVTFIAVTAVAAFLHLPLTKYQSEYRYTNVTIAPNARGIVRGRRAIGHLGLMILSVRCLTMYFNALKV